MHAVPRADLHQGSSTDRPLAGGADGASRAERDTPARSGASQGRDGENPLNNVPRRLLQALGITSTPGLAGPPGIDSGSLGPPWPATAPRPSPSASHSTGPPAPGHWSPFRSITPGGKSTHALAGRERGALFPHNMSGNIHAPGLAAVTAGAAVPPDGQGPRMGIFRPAPKTSKYVTNLLEWRDVDRARCDPILSTRAYPRARASDGPARSSRPPSRLLGSESNAVDEGGLVETGDLSLTGGRRRAHREAQGEDIIAQAGDHGQTGKGRAQSPRTASPSAGRGSGPKPPATQMFVVDSDETKYRGERSLRGQRCVTFGSGKRPGF